MQIVDTRDAYIDRDHQPGMAFLYDCDGCALGVFPGDMTDFQIKAALSFANTWYARGVERGQQMKAEQLRAALGL